jgi:hypothetical protein
MTPTTPPAGTQTPSPGAVQETLRSARRTWRQHRGRWHNIRPVVLLGLGVVSLVLGVIGYLQLGKINGLERPYGFLDALYRAIGLFAFGGTVSPPVPWTLQVARILAPILTGYAVIGTVLALAREQARVLAIRFFVRKHVIVAGLGATGSRLALALVDHEPVVVIESDPNNERHAAARLRGVWVLVGEATDEVMLRRAGIRHARTLVVACGTDSTNVDVAAAATRVITEARLYPLTIFSHLRDLDLWSSLAAEGATFGTLRPGVRLEYFNILATGAQLMLERDPPFGPTVPGHDPEPRHVLIVGLDGIGEQLVLQIARLWTGLDPERLRITITGPTADRDLDDLRARYPSLDRYCKLGSRELDLASARFQSGAAMVNADETSDVSHAYVSLDDEGQALLAALALHARPDTANVPVTVAVSDADAGIAILVESEQGRFATIKSFGVLSAATSDELLLRGTNELLARAQHAQWLRNEQAKGLDPEINPNMKPWEQLTEPQREENRRFADDLHVKLGLIGCMLVPLPLPDPAHKPFEFSDSELDLLSRHEHERWMASKLADGWTFGPRDDAKKIHDQIKPWEQLDESNKDKDRNAVREIPAMLALAGFGIQKTSGV